MLMYLYKKHYLVMFSWISLPTHHSITTWTLNLLINVCNRGCTIFINMHTYYIIHIALTEKIFFTSPLPKNFWILVLRLVIIRFMFITKNKKWTTSIFPKRNKFIYYYKYLSQVWDRNFSWVGPKFLWKKNLFNKLVINSY